MDKDKLIQIGVYSLIALGSGLIMRAHKKSEAAKKLLLIRDDHFRSEIYNLKGELEFISPSDVEKVESLFRELKVLIARYVEYTDGNAEYLNNILYNYELKLKKSKRYTEKMLVLRKAFNRMLD